MSISQFTYTGPEALEMIKNTFPKTWENEIEEGQQFIKALMRMYKLSATDAFTKYLKVNGSPANGICTLAALHLLLIQIKDTPEIVKIQSEQLAYGNQLVALEASTNISKEDKETLRSFYLTKQNELQKCINRLVYELPSRNSEKIIVRTTLFDRP